MFTGDINLLHLYKRFHEHAQNLLGGVKRQVGIIEHRGQKGYYYSKKYYIIML